MKVRELITWLTEFSDQDADVEVVAQVSDGDYYQQDGVYNRVLFDPEEHVDYVDMRGNIFVKPGDPYENKRTLLLGDKW